MFGLIRRISHSVIPRPDRPWADDPTSNAPQKGKKRRLSSTEPEPDADAEEAAKKKIRGESTASDAGSSQLESKAVKEVTQGVNEVDLADAEAAVAPEAVPLPDEESDELDEPASESTPPPEAEAEAEVDDNASSVNEEQSEPLVNGTASNASSENAEEGGEAAVAQEKEGLVAAPAATQLEKKTKAPAKTTPDGSTATE